jgi:hypothetical protein
MSLSTKDVGGTEGSGGLKTILPGQQKLKINSIELKQFSFMESAGGYYFIMNVETEPIENFEGFLIDIDDPSKGRYEGQVGQVKTNRYYYKDGETKGGTEIKRDVELMKQIKKVCSVTDCINWFDKADGKYETIEDMVAGFNKSAKFKDTYLNVTVAGKEYARNNGYTGYDLFLPKLSKMQVAMEPVDAKISKLIPFNESEHWNKLVAKPVSEFGGDDISTGTPDLGDAPDFEL